MIEYTLQVPTRPRELWVLIAGRATIHSTEDPQEMFEFLQSAQAREIDREIGRAEHDAAKYQRDLNVTQEQLARLREFQEATHGIS